MKAEYAITEDEYVNANKLFTRLTRPILKFYTAVSIVLVLSALVMDSLTIKIGLLDGLVGVILGRVFVRHLYLTWKARKQYRVYQAAGEMVVINGRRDSVFDRFIIGVSYQYCIYIQ